MTSLFSGIVFITLAVIGFSSFISTALSASRDARSATLSVRSAPAPNVPTCTLPLGRGPSRV